MLNYYWIRIITSAAAARCLLPAVGQRRRADRPLLGPVKLRGFGLRVAVGAGLVVVIRADGTLWAWSENGSGQLGTGLSAAAPPFGAFVRVGHGQQWCDIAAGRDTSLRLQADGSCWLWGENGVAWNESSVQALAPYR